jgi:hypothetical protein
MPAGIKPNDGAAPTVTVKHSTITIPIGLSAIVVPSRTTPAAPAPVRAKKKAARKGNSFLYLMIAAGLAVAASGFVLNRTWPKFLALAPSPAPVVANKPDPAVQNKSGQIIIPRANTDLCDRYMFDNASGQMKQAATMPCSSVGKKPEINLSDQVNSFHSSWRGSGGAPGGPNAPRGSGPEAGPPPR